LGEGAVKAIDSQLLRGGDKIASRAVLQYEEVSAILEGVAEPVEGHNIGMVQPAENLQFVEKLPLALLGDVFPGRCR
jgi:hypothetical protein